MFRFFLDGVLKRYLGRVRADPDALLCGACMCICEPRHASCSGLLYPLTNGEAPFSSRDEDAAVNFLSQRARFSPICFRNETRASQKRIRCSERVRTGWSSSWWNELNAQPGSHRWAGDDCAVLKGPGKPGSSFETDCGVEGCTFT